MANKLSKLNVSDIIASSGGKVFKKLNTKATQEEITSIKGIWRLNETLTRIDTTTTIYRGGYAGWFYTKASETEGDYHYTSFKQIELYPDEDMVLFELSTEGPTMTYPRAGNIYYANGEIIAHYAVDGFTSYIENVDERFRIFEISIYEGDDESETERFLAWLKANATKIA